ncbi:hypothetical protein Ahy_A01g000367 [Arachis hypogaea]|uniref:Uncharacterized protein n=1 Tax=Arachis hypogaea TaxID=3818 RepID=A0A445EKA9_ARAHY|nr:hypothetical protein Ahy_A01g000367 [Arachis hypogaea]
MQGTEEVSSNFQENFTPEVEEDPIGNETFVAETESVLIGASQADDQRDVIVLDGIGSFGAIDFDALQAEEIMMIEFADLKTAYDFYNENDRKMDPRPVTRCGCNARIQVHVDSRNGRWYVEFFFDEHNHDMLEARFRGMMRSHRAIKTGDLHQINTMRSFGLRVPTIFRAFANQSGGFEMVGFEESSRCWYKSAYGDPVVKTRLEELERFAVTIYTREVFVLFREVLLLASNVRVVSSKKTSTCTLFEVAMYCQGRSWNVSWGEMDDEFRCSCLRMESFGIPCVHITGVLVRLNMVVIPDSLILAYMSMHAAMLDDCRELVKLSCSYFEDYFEVKTKIANERDALREKIRKRYRRVQRCRKCGKAGHNARRCIDGNGDDTMHELDAFESSHNMDESQEAEASQQMEYDGLSF